MKANQALPITGRHQCSKCGALLPAGDSGAVCPACLMLAGLDEPDAGCQPSSQTVPHDSEGENPRRIDRYKILQKLGEGGCGVVYMAEQSEPVRRRVALKVIKLGMDTRQVIARFEAERQALAMMDHPNIAKVLDAGTTGQGRSYFVMELVKGVRITDYCDQNHLSTPERLALFMQVCQAIQHAHQKGIIHRDVKPSNILVTLHDGVAVPKVIDFGIAKATEQPLTDKTVFTAVGQFMGTPAYMSPEQAELSGLDIDTRSDIYSLGVLLYELLTGRTPFDAKELLQGGVDEMRRRIREEEPLRPSTRLSTMADADLTEVAHRRQVAPAQLPRFIRGDLDWIVMKCLEKDRSRRYETANGLAVDIRRHLNNEPVVARPPSAAYRFQKLVCRHKMVMTAVGAAAAALLIGLAVSTWLYFKEREAHEAALLAEKKSEAKERQARQSEEDLRKLVEMFREKWVTRASLPGEPANAGMAPGATDNIPSLVPPGDPRLKGKTYAQWAAEWWKWSQQMPLTNSAGAVHPFFDTPNFDVSAHQTSDVWFLAAPFGTTRRSCVIPAGISLFFPIFNVESSSLEPNPFYGATAEEQARKARFWADHAVDIFCQIDGVAVTNLGAYRVQSPQIEINVPSPWIQGKTGGRGTSSGDGYWVFLEPLSPGQHTLHFGAKLRLSQPRDPMTLSEDLDTTYQLRVAAPPP